METLKVGIIGAGWMGHVHARAYQRLAQHWPDLAVRPELVAVADSSAPAAEDFARAHGGTTYAATNLPTNSVGTKQLKKNAVTGAKIQDRAVTADKINRTGLSVPNAFHATYADAATNAQGAQSAAYSAYSANAANATNATNASHATTATSATSATTATNALNLGGVPASRYFRGPLEAPHVVGTAGNPGAGRFHV